MLCVSACVNVWRARQTKTRNSAHKRTHLRRDRERETQAIKHNPIATLNIRGAKNSQRNIIIIY